MVALLRPLILKEPQADLLESLALSRGKTEIPCWTFRDLAGFYPAPPPSSIRHPRRVLFLFPPKHTGAV